MVHQLPKANKSAPQAPESVSYPDSDGQPMADNTLQFQWIVVLKDNLEQLFAQDPNVFVAGDLLWYPVEGNNKIRQAPDALVAFGQPKGYRGSYLQWKEDNIAPQVVFEVLSPGNRRTEMARKLLFYERYGVEEYYECDPYTIELVGYQRQDTGLEPIEILDNWVSPRLGIRFVLTSNNLEVYRPDGLRFLTFVELSQQLDEKNQQVAQLEADNQRLAAKLRELGVDPSSL